MKPLKAKKIFIGEASEMAKWVKELAAKRDNLNSVLRTPKSCPLTSIYCGIQVPALANKLVFKNKKKLF